MWWRCGGPECICYALDVFVVAEYCICIVEHDVFVAAQDIFVGWLQMEHGCAAPPPQASLLPVHWKAAFRSRDRAGELFKSGASLSVQKVLLILRTETLDHTIKRMILFQSRAVKQHPTPNTLQKKDELLKKCFPYEPDYLYGSACCKENGLVQNFKSTRSLCPTCWKRTDSLTFFVVCGINWPLVLI